MTNDRKNLEWLVFWALKEDQQIISFDRGRELLGFNVYQMRDWYKEKVKNEDY